MDIATNIAKSVRMLSRQVWCRSCGYTCKVVNGLRDGWPKCCGQTMTIDPPAPPTDKKE